jgi:peptidoglycan/LPS O-acetylase OafA/YrhL
MSTESLVISERLKMEQGVASRRIPAFDFTKGALVLFMVLYHWLNYFHGPQGEIYKYLRFLTPSFIFITGFLISHVHFAKYGVSSLNLSARLFVRGIKLLIVFVALNAVVSLFEPSSFVRNISLSQTTFKYLNTVFGMGTMTGIESAKIAAFTILVPISYLLILSSALSIACGLFKYTFHVVCILALLFMAILDFHGVQSTNLELVSVGLLGAVSGYASRNQLQRLVSQPWVILCAYCVYLAAITIWDVSLYVQMVGACLTTALIYMVGMRTEDSKLLQSGFVLLGKYSLFGYIAQIAILQLLNVSLKHVHHGPVILAASLLAGVILTMILVETMDRGRMMSKTVDRFYKAVFA